MTAARLIRLDETTAPGAVDASPCALVIGNFDGVHRGHVAVLGQAVARARASPPLAVCALTFDPHPAHVLGAGPVPLLTSLEDRVELLGGAGVQRVYARRFDRGFAAWTPERFAEELVANTLDAKQVVVGQDFRFGVGRSGDLARLRELGALAGFEVLVPAIVADEKGPLSSTRARDALLAGDFDEVVRVLGRPHAVTGVVVAGDARGRTLGFPTANLQEIPQLLPPDGVYAVLVSLRNADGAYDYLARGVANVGMRPTIGGGPRTLEVHLLDVGVQIYGQHLRVAFIAKLRNEKKFGSLEDLKAGIADDVVRARELLERQGLR